MGDTAPPEGGDLFTRGGLNMPDNRGKSMVAIHLDKLQKEKEERGMEKLSLLLPQLSAATHAVALQECNWEEDKALAMLRLFVSKKADELKKLAKEKKKHHKKLLERMKKAAGDNNGDKSSGSDGSKSSSSSSGSDSDSGSDSSGSSEDDRRGRDRRKKDSRKRSRSFKDRHSKKKRSRKEKDSKKRSRRDGLKKDRKKERREKSSKSHRRTKDKDDKPRSKDYEYGKYGIIRETDYYTKRSEFMLWALEVKNSDVEAMSRFEEKELFKSYMEDYNTATLPHKKFYDLEAWEREAAATGGGRGGGGGGEKMVFNDEAERKKELLVERQREHAERLRAAYEELQTTDKAQAMREQELMRAKMALAYRTGDQKEAARLAERLKPDEPK